MTYEEKFQKVIGKLKDERELTRKGRRTQVTFDDKSFTKVRINDICKILLKLRDDERVVSLVVAFQPMQSDHTKFEQCNNDDDDFERVVEIIVEVDEVFDRWYENYLVKQKSRPHNLDWLNLLKINDVCQDIDSQLQITKEAKITIPSFPYPYIGRSKLLFPVDTIGTRKNYQQFRWEGVKYLEKEAVVTQVRYEDNDMLGYANISMRVNISSFEDFYANIKQEFEKRKQKGNTMDKKKHEKVSEHEPVNKTEDTNEIVHQITYTKNRQILMDDKVQIGNPDFNSENDLVFSYLYESPNRRITVEEIENKIGGKLTKTLHKIVENLGFEGDTKKLFFSVSKGVIEFRNPVTKKDLGGKKPLIKLIKGGGKLIMPH